MNDFDGLEFDQEYIKKLRAGDKDIEEHFLAYFGALLRIRLHGRLDSNQQIESVRDKVLSRVLESIRSASTIDYSGQLTLFVSKVCKEILREHSGPGSPSSPAATSLSTLGRSSDAEEAWIRKLVQQIIGGFSEKEQQLLRAVLVDKRRSGEVCKEMGFGPDHLPLLLFRAKKRLLQDKMLKRDDR